MRVKSIKAKASLEPSGYRCPTSLLPHPNFIKERSLPASSISSALTSPHNPMKSDFLPHSSAKTAGSDVYVDHQQAKSKDSFFVLIVWHLTFLTALLARFSSLLFTPSALSGPNSSSSLFVDFLYCTKWQWLEPRPIIFLSPLSLPTFTDDFLIHIFHPDLSFKPQACISSRPIETLCILSALVRVGLVMLW